MAGIGGVDMILALTQDSLNGALSWTAGNMLANSANVVFGTPSIAVQGPNDTNSDAVVILTLPVTSGTYNQNSINGLSLVVRTNVIVQDVTDQLKNSNPAAGSFLANLKAGIDFSVYSVSAIQIDLASATYSDVQSATEYPPGFPSDQQEDLFAYIQSIVEDHLVLGFMLLLLPGQDTAAYPFQATGLQLTATPASDSGLEKSMLNLCMMTNYSSFPTATGTGEFSTSLYSELPSYYSSFSPSSLPGGIFLVAYDLFETNVLQPYIDAITGALAIGYPGISYTEDESAATQITWNTGTLSKTMGPHTFGAEWLGMGIKAEATPSMFANLTLAPKSTDNSTSLVFSGSFNFTIPITLQTETLWKKSPLASFTVSTAGTWTSPDYPKMPVGTDGVFVVTIESATATPPTNDDSGDDYPKVVPAGNFTFSIAKPKAAVLGFTSEPDISDPSTASKIIKDLIVALLGAIVPGETLAALIAKIIGELEQSYELNKISVGEIDQQIGDLLTQSTQAVEAAATSLGEVNLVIPGASHYDLRDLFLANFGGQWAVATAVTYNVS